MLKMVDRQSDLPLHVKLRMARAGLGLSQTAAAAAVGANQTSLCQYEKKGIKNVSAEKLQRLVEFYEQNGVIFSSDGVSLVAHEEVSDSVRRMAEALIDGNVSVSDPYVVRIVSMIARERALARYSR